MVEEARRDYSVERRIAQQKGGARVTNTLPDNLDTLVREAMESPLTRPAGKPSRAQRRMAVA